MAYVHDTHEIANIWLGVHVLRGNEAHRIMSGDAMMVLQGIAGDVLLTFFSGAGKFKVSSTIAPQPGRLYFFFSSSVEHGFVFCCDLATCICERTLFCCPIPAGKRSRRTTSLIQLFLGLIHARYVRSSTTKQTTSLHTMRYKPFYFI